MLGLSDLPVALRRYVVAISVGGPLVALAAAILLPPDMSQTRLQRMVLLLAFAAVAEFYTLQVTHKTSINLASACYLAMVLVFPAAVPGLLTFGAGLAGQLLRRRKDPVEALFNASQASLYVSAGALTFALSRESPYLGPSLETFGAVGAVAVLALILHVANTTLVAGAAALQLRVPLWRVLRRDVADDPTAQVAIALLGITIAVMVIEQPWLLPGLALPLILIHRAIAENVQLRRDTYRALASLVDIVELCDPYTAGHSQRVAMTARMLALRLGLTYEEADAIETAGRVHDVGKVGIQRDILVKTGKLSDAEFAEIQRHPALGADVVARFAAYADGHRLVRHHHERWDGRGYPDSLAADAIPFGARILAVADAFDAMTSDRAYRGAMAIDKACRIIAEGAGTQWDPVVVKAFLTHLDQVITIDIPRSTHLPAACPAT